MVPHAGQSSSQVRASSCAGWQMARAGGADAVHLGLERVEHAHAGAACEERLHEVGADEARAAGDENGGGDHGAVNLRTTAAWSWRAPSRTRRRAASVSGSRRALWAKARTIESASLRLRRLTCHAMRATSAAISRAASRAGSTLRPKRRRLVW